MAGSRKATVVSGFDIVQSLGTRRGASSAVAEPPPPAQRPPPAGSVAMPTRREIACPDCGWESHVMGRQTYAVCPKCRKKIDIVDYTIDVDFAGTLTTAGRVRLTQGCVMRSGEIRAAMVDLESRVEGGRIVAWHRLNLRVGAVCTSGQVEFRDLRLDAGADFASSEPLTCRGLDVAGDLRGSFTVSGSVIVRTGGIVHGVVRCGHLAVEEGGGLDADIHVGPDALREPPPE
ncbi:MAG: polymer-forming cytoskeletal protein [Verrucomicrobia bacterium]|nr:polymer-forming cytoskeletal protein [Verrucomicrobiota bacterium]